MAVVGEAILTAVIENLFDKLSSPRLLEFANREKIRDDLKKWEKILHRIHAVLDDAEEKQMKNRSVKLWLSELNQLAYDVEDILDEFATEDLRIKLVNEPQASTSKVQKLIPSCFTGLSPRSIKFNVKMASEIKEITTRLEEIMTQKDSLNLIDKLGASSFRVEYRRLPGTSLNEPHIYGREKDKETIVEWLLTDEGSDNNFSVISIVGMGGIGKTTLAQLAYNDVRVEAFFNFKVWACVSDDFDVVGLTKTILESVAPGAADFNDLNNLQVALKERLSGKKFFIVLDDVWNENYDVWTLFCLPFQIGSPGSKILVTTRNQGVSNAVGAHRTYQLNKLSNDDCSSVFTQHSLGKNNFNEYQHLEETGKKIIKKCDGLPLAAKSLGGLLRGKFNYKDWEDVLISKIWNLPEEKGGIIPALRVSYHYLPRPLKRCFAYCSIFPKDYKIVKEDIILLWMAEGFLESRNTKKEKEDLGDEYFQDLHSRSFFQQLSGTSDASRFVMHDLIHDLAQWATEDICSRIENLKEVEKHGKITKNIRHISYLTDDSIFDHTKLFGVFNEMKNVRTLLTPTVFPMYWYSSSSDVGFPRMVHQLRRLRVLSLKHYFITKIPDSIGDLKLLHHLDLSHTQIEFLPDSINTLFNLETIILIQCSQLKRLCSDMGNLIKLRHLYFPFPIPLPSRIGQLTSLRTLKWFVVGKDIRSRLRVLKDLKNLRGRLHISGLENVNDSGDAEKADLEGKGGLTDMQLEWTCSNDGSNEKEIAAQVLDKLRPCQKLESLHIQGFSGTRFPSWLGEASFSSLVNLKFDKCKNCAFLPSMGQLPLLKNLVICNMDEIKSMGPEFYGDNYSTPPFQSLEELHIWNMRAWRDWIPAGSGTNVEPFPSLRQLSISCCPKLFGNLPDHLPSLEVLTIHLCLQLTASIPIVPKRCTIQIAECKEVVPRSMKDHSLLSSMVHSFSLSGISRGIFLADGYTKGFFKAEKLELINFDESIPVFTIEHDAACLVSYDRFNGIIIEEEKEDLQQQELPCRVQYMVLKDCKCPVKLAEALLSLSFLRGLSIRESPKIVCFPEAVLPSQLRFIVVEKCDALQSLPSAWMHSSNTSLAKMFISYCDSLTRIARFHLPPNLKRLEIKHCSNLLTVLDEEEVPGSCRNTPYLEYLKIESFPSLTCLWSKSKELPDTPREIELPSCSNLTTLASTGNLPKALRCLSITGCSKLESIAKSFHDNTKLENLHIEDCERLEVLPSGMNNLISLRNLFMKKCSGIAVFPEGGFPTSLVSLEISDRKICTSLFEWGLHKLTSLEALSIRGGCPDVRSFPQEEIGMILPISLKSLEIEDFPNLERLSSIAQNLSCLEELCLYECSKLKHFPENGLPQSLQRLYIDGCPRLVEKCEIDTGLYWPMIAHLSLSKRKKLPNSELKCLLDDALPSSLTR